MELEGVSSFILKIGARRVRARFRGRTPGREVIFKLFSNISISSLVEGQVLFEEGGSKYFSNGVFYFPEPDLAVFYLKGGILPDRRRAERLNTGEIVGCLRDMKDISGKMAISAHEISESGAKIATYYPLAEKKSGYIMELDLDPKIFHFSNLQMGSVIFNSHCEVVNMQANRKNEILYGINFTHIPSESQHLIRVFLRDYEVLLEDEKFTGRISQTVPGGGRPPPSLPVNKTSDETSGKAAYRGILYTSDIRPVPLEKGKPAAEREHISHHHPPREIPAAERQDGAFFHLLEFNAWKVLIVSMASFCILFFVSLLCQFYTEKRVMREIVSSPRFFSLLSDIEKYESRVKNPLVKQVKSEKAVSERIEKLPRFQPTVPPSKITPANFARVIDENKLPVYSIDDTGYISVRSLMKLFDCPDDSWKGKASVSVPYKNSRIILMLRTSEMIAGGQKTGMVYPVKRIGDEFLVSIDVVEEALILSQ